MTRACGGVVKRQRLAKLNCGGRRDRNQWLGCMLEGESRGRASRARDTSSSTRKCSSLGTAMRLFLLLFRFSTFPHTTLGRLLFQLYSIYSNELSWYGPTLCPLNKGIQCLHRHPPSPPSFTTLLHHPPIRVCQDTTSIMQSNQSQLSHLQMRPKAELLSSLPRKY
jgi:hypothetical protein